MPPLEILVLSVLAISSAAHLSPVSSEGEPQIQFPLNPDRSQSCSSDSKQPTSQSGYQCHISKYPSTHEWLPWDRLWDINREQVLSSNGGDTYIQHYVEEAILQVADESDIDARLILAVLMQETKGKARGDCKKGSKCGILQGRLNFDEKRPSPSILEMIREGVREGSHQSGLNDRLKRESSPYAAIWKHHRDRNLGESSADETRFVSDVANRLAGWNGRGKGCKERGEYARNDDKQRS